MSAAALAAESAWWVRLREEAGLHDCLQPCRAPPTCQPPPLPAVRPAGASVVGRWWWLLRRRCWAARKELCQHRAPQAQPPLCDDVLSPQCARACV